MSAQTSVETLGWDRGAFVERLATKYVIRERKTNKLIKLGPAMARRKAQFKAMQDLLDAISRGGPVNELWLKPRRSGRSTIAECVLTDLAAFGGFNCGVMAHDEDSTGTLFRMARTFIERLLPSERPELRRETNTMMEFGTKRRKDRDAEDGAGVGELARFDCRTAGGRHPFAGGTLHSLHGSEVPKWPGSVVKQESAIADVLNSMAADFPTIVIMEGTGNGPQGWFYEVFCEAMKYVDKPGRYPWRPTFMAWFEDEGNRKAVPDYVAKEWLEEDKKTLEEEAYLVRQFGVDQEQLYFRRYQIKKLKSTQQFRRDYPATWTEAFSSTGNNVFEEEHLQYQLENFVKAPLGRGHLITDLGDL